MLKNNKKSIVLLALSLIALVGCDSDRIKYPSNYDDPMFNTDQAVTEDDAKEVVETEYKHYYSSLASDNEVYEKTVNDILTTVSRMAYNYDGTEGDSHDVTKIVKDTYEGSIAFNYDAASAVTGDNLEVRTKRSLASTAKNGSYEKDNLYFETKFAQYLNETYYYLNINKDGLKQDGQLITPELQYDDIYSDYDTNYKTYAEEELYDDYRINYLTTQYIYDKTYASIGNSNARNVQIIALTDRSDEPGDAKKLLNAYVRDYIKGDKKDDDFYTLSRLWKGITKDIATAVDNSDTKDRYGDEIVLSAEEEQWLKDNGIITTTGDNTYYGNLIGKVMDDKKKLEDGEKSYLKVDSSLESSYTGSYTYDIDTGIRKAVDDIATKSFITKGIYLKSAGISSIPSDLSDRIFSPKLTSSKATLENMKANPGTTSDLTVFENDGYRYITVADTVSDGTDDSLDNIVYYDSSSKTYYLCRVLDVIDTACMSKTATDSIYDTEAKKELMARQVAYALSTTGSYKTDSAVYWLSRCDIDYSDEDFLDYMKSNYKDIFKSENPWADEAKIKLPH